MNVTHGKNNPSPPTTYDSVYVSPHLDDAVLSCAGRIGAEADAGRRVLIATVFTRGGDDPHSRRVYAARREEDRRAAAVLGAEVVHLDLPDAPFRNPFYRDFRSIVLQEHPDDAAFVPVVAEAVAGVLRSAKPQAVYLPLAVGTHIDHRITYRATDSLGGGFECAWYEDRPYAFVRHNVRLRLAEIGARFSPVPPDLAELPADELERTFRESLADCAFVNAYLPPGPQRDLCCIELTRRLLAGSAGGGPTLRPEMTEFDAASGARSAAAIGGYASQVPDLFGSAAGIAPANASYAGRLGSAAPWAERVWRPG